LVSIDSDYSEKLKNIEIISDDDDDGFSTKEYSNKDTLLSIDNSDEEYKN